jgi:CheY-like chemotaxis protein
MMPPLCRGIPGYPPFSLQRLTAILDELSHQLPTSFPCPSETISTAERALYANVTRNVAPTPSLGCSTLNKDTMLVTELMNANVRHPRLAHAQVPALRILVVDNYPDSADFLAKFLIYHGHLVEACCDGASALVTATQFRPHVCVLDLAIPGMGGLELAARLKAGAGTGPLILIAATAFGDLEIRTQTALAGFHYHFTKPVDLPAMVEAVTYLGKSFGKLSPDSCLSSESPKDEPNILTESLW